VIFFLSFADDFLLLIETQFLQRSFIDNNYLCGHPRLAERMNYGPEEIHIKTSCQQDLTPHGANVQGTAFAY
jgi:hypothetical protein